MREAIKELSDSELETLHKAVDSVIEAHPILDRVDFVLEVSRLDRFLHEELARRWRN